MNKNPKHFILIGFLFALVAIILSVGAGVFNYFPGDLWFSKNIQSFTNPQLTVFSKGLSWIFGDWHTVILIIPVWLLVWWKTSFMEGLLVPLSGLISLINDGLKMVIGRPRPAPELVNVMIPYHSSSFPSGHTFFAVMFLGVLTFLFFSHFKRIVWRVIVLITAILFIMLIGFTRIYLGLHWASDILGGLVWGGMFLFILIGLVTKAKAGASQIRD